MQSGDSAPTLGRVCHLGCVTGLMQCHWGQQFCSPVALSSSGQCPKELQPTTPMPGFALFPPLTCSGVLHLSGFCSAIMCLLRQEEHQAPPTCRALSIFSMLTNTASFWQTIAVSREVSSKLTKKSSSNEV